MKNLFPRESLLNRMERWTLRIAVALFVTGVVFAAGSEIGPFLIYDTNGATRIRLGDGTNQDNIAMATGKFIFLDEDDNWGTVAAPAAANDTHTISVTFDTAEPDVVTPEDPPDYEILLVTRGVTSSAGNVAGPYVGARYADGFQIINPALLGSGVTFVWQKFRTGR